MSNEQALGHTPGPGGGLATLGKPRPLLARGQAGQGPPLGREGPGTVTSPFRQCSLGDEWGVQKIHGQLGYVPSEVTEEEASELGQEGPAPDPKPRAPSA